MQCRKQTQRHPESKTWTWRACESPISLINNTRSWGGRDSVSGVNPARSVNKKVITRYSPFTFNWSGLATNWLTYVGDRYLEKARWINCLLACSLRHWYRNAIRLDRISAIVGDNRLIIVLVETNISTPPNQIVDKSVVVKMSCKRSLSWK